MTGTTLARLREMGARRAAKVRRNAVRRIAAGLREDGLRAEADGDAVRVTARRDDGRLRWLAAWAKEMLR